MTQLDRKVREAFADVRAPEAACRDALAAIEQHREASSALVPAAGSGARRRRGASVLAPLALAVALALAFIGVGVFLGSQGREAAPPSAPAPAPAAYVGIDVNPSIELAVSEDGSVLAAEALNADAEGLLGQADLTGLPYGRALASLVEGEGFAAYRTSGSLVEVDVVSADDALAARLMDESDAVLAALPCATACTRASEADRQAAADAGMGIGRYRAACELVGLDPSLTVQDCAHLSMAELRERIDACSDGGSGRPGQHAFDSAGKHRGQGQGLGAGAGHHGGHGRS